jgi:hypothetical protein
MKTLTSSTSFTRSRLLVATVGLLIASCGGSSPDAASPEATVETVPETAPPAQSAEAPEPAHPAAPATWAEALTPEQKGAFMAQRVVPAMQPVFAQATEFGCKTCHGPAQVEGKAFAHPNQYLPRLEFKNGKLTQFETHPEVAKFMSEKVLPAMAQVMGKELYSEANPTGMGCNGCHAVDMK